MERYVTHYNTARPHSALRYLTPADYSLGPAHVDARLAARAAAYRAAKRRTYWHSQSTTALAPSLVRNSESLISAEPSHNSCCAMTYLSSVFM